VRAALRRVGRTLNKKVAQDQEVGPDQEARIGRRRNASPAAAPARS